jgi:Arc/MetJ-type ribon-helix-helix transcriptional regulator
MYKLERRTTIQVSEELRKELRILASRRDVNYQELLSDMISVFKELDKDRAIVSIPKALEGRIRESIKTSDFKTVSEWVTFVIRLMFYEQANPEKADEKKIKKQLKALGYL